MNLLNCNKSSKIDSSVTRVSEHLKNFVGHVEEKGSLNLALKDVEIKLSALKNAKRSVTKQSLPLKINQHI